MKAKSSTQFFGTQGFGVNPTFGDDAVHGRSGTCIDSGNGRCAVRTDIERIFSLAEYLSFPYRAVLNPFSPYNDENASSSLYAIGLLSDVTTNFGVGGSGWACSLLNVSAAVWRLISPFFITFLSYVRIRLLAERISKQSAKGNTANVKSLRYYEPKQYKKC